MLHDSDCTFSDHFVFHSFIFRDVRRARLTEIAELEKSAVERPVV